MKRRAFLGLAIASPVALLVPAAIVALPKIEAKPSATAFGITEGQVIYAGEIREVIRSEQQGKGGPVLDWYTYRRSYVIRICPDSMHVDAVIRNGKIIDARHFLEREDGFWNLVKMADDVTDSMGAVPLYSFQVS